MPTLLRVSGFRFFFFSKEGHEPPHIHVEKAECHAKYWLFPVGLARSGGFNKRELTRLRKFVDGRVDFFLEKWNEHFNA